MPHHQQRFGGRTRCQQRRRARGREARGAARGRRRERARRGSPARPGGLDRGRPAGRSAREVGCAVARTPSPTELTLERRARLLASARPFTGASVQKLWLLSPAVALLQLRVPRRNILVVVEARLGIAAVVTDRPTTSDAAPTSQATLRAALEGARLASARLELLTAAT